MQSRGRGSRAPFNFSPPPPRPPPLLGLQHPWRPRTQMLSENDQFRPQPRGDRQQQQRDPTKGTLKRPSSAPWNNLKANFNATGDIWAPMFPQNDFPNEGSAPKRFTNLDNYRSPNFRPRGPPFQGPPNRSHGFPNNHQFFPRPPGVRPQSWVNRSPHQTIRPLMANQIVPSPPIPMYEDGPLKTHTIEDVLDMVVCEVKDHHPMTASQIIKFRARCRQRIKTIIVGMPSLPTEVLHKMYRNLHDLSSEIEYVNKLQLGADTEVNESEKANISQRDRGQDCDGTPGNGSDAIVYPRDPEFLFQPVTTVTTVVMERISQAVGLLVKELKKNYHITNHHIKGIKQIIHTRMVDIMTGKPVHDEHEMYKFYRNRYPLATDPWLIKSFGCARVVKKSYEIPYTSNSAKSNEGQATKPQDSNPQTDKTLSKKGAGVVKRALTNLYQQMESKLKLTASHFDLVRPILRGRLQIMFIKHHPQTVRELRTIYREQYDHESDEQLIKNLSNSNDVSTAGNTTVKELSGTAVQCPGSTGGDDLIDDAKPESSPQGSEVGTNIDSIIEENQGTFKEDFKEHSEIEETHFNEQQLKLHTFIESRVDDIFAKHLVKIIAKDRELIKAGMPGTWAGRAPFCPKTLHYVKIFGRPNLPSLDLVREFLEYYDPSVLLELHFKTDGPIEALFVGMIRRQTRKALSSRRTLFVGGQIIGVSKTTVDVLYKYRNFLKNVDLWSPTTAHKVTQTGEDTTDSRPADVSVETATRNDVDCEGLSSFNNETEEFEL